MNPRLVTKLQLGRVPPLGTFEEAVGNVRILILVDRFPPTKIGGVWEAALQLRLAYEREGHSVFVLTNGDYSPTEDGKFINRTSRGLFLGTLLIMWCLRSFCSRHDIDVVHAHQPLCSPALLFLKLLNRKIRIVASFHTTYFSEYVSIVPRWVGGKKYRPIYFEYLRKFIAAPVHISLDLISYLVADEVTAVSSVVKREIEKTYGKVSQKEVQVVSNGVLTAEKPQERISEDRFVFFAGAFKARKGIWELLNAFSTIDQPHLKLVIAGEGKGYENLIRQEIKKLGLTSRVFLLGKVSNLEILNWLSKCEVFCLPSLMEGHPVILLEAMSVGAAIVATNIGGVNETIQDGINGILVPPGDFVMLGEAISRLTMEPATRSALGEAARSTVEEKYRWDGSARKYLDSFQSSLVRGELQLQTASNIDCR